MGGTLASYFVQFLKNEEALTRDIADPVLLFEPSAEGDSITDAETGGLATDRKFQYRTSSGAGSLLLKHSEPMVFHLRKDKDNAFQRGVTIGRTGNNDVVLEDPSVSRFHAWFQRDPASATWSLVDAGSKNGSWVGSERLMPKRPWAVTQKTAIRFGQVEMTFLLPTDFLRLLKRHSGK